MKLNIGAGGKRIAGFTGVDAVERPGADVIVDAGKLPFEDASVEEIMAIHLLEHLLPWEVLPTLKEWARVLKPGGNLVLEMPDVVKCCRNLLDGIQRGGKHPDQLSYWGLYGDPRLEDPYMLHRFGWCFKTLQPLVVEAGFLKVKERQTIFHPAGRDVRDFRLEAIKA